LLILTERGGRVHAPVFFFICIVACHIRVGFPSILICDTCIHLPTGFVPRSFCCVIANRDRASHSNKIGMDFTTTTHRPAPWSFLCRLFVLLSAKALQDSDLRDIREIISRTSFVAINSVLGIPRTDSKALTLSFETRQLPLVSNSTISGTNSTLFATFGKRVEARVGRDLRELVQRARAVP
jgi:hypothetical protein